MRVCFLTNRNKTKKVCDKLAEAARTGASSPIDKTSKWEASEESVGGDKMSPSQRGRPTAKRWVVRRLHRIGLARQVLIVRRNLTSLEECCRCIAM